jgi:cytochrome c-type biogenesis protein CcmH/NrfF
MFKILLLAPAMALLSPQQTTTVKRAENALLAPCCYTQSIALHESPVAAQMRQEVTEMAASGLSEQEIMEHYKAIYGERILIVPDGRTGQVLFAFPSAVFITCLAILAFFVRKMLRVREGTSFADLPLASGVKWDSVRARIEQETEDFF